MSVTENMKSLQTGPPGQDTIPIASRDFGSWHVEISRGARTPCVMARQYDGVAENWPRTAHRFQLEAAYREALLASGAHIALAGSTARAMDCGVGSGTLSIALASILPKQIECHGIDMSREMLATANIAMKQAKLSLTLNQADILSIPYPDQFFDLVMAAHVLEHLPDPRCALSEMIRVLKPGGLLFVCMTRRSFFGALVQLRWRTWAITERQGVGWMRDCEMSNVAFQPVNLGACAGQSSLAFWAHKPG